MPTTSTLATELRRDSDVVVPRCTVAKTPLRRMKGLLGRSGLADDEGLLLQPAGAVHTWFMRFPIDVVFLDKQLRVVRVAEDVRPWRFASAKGAKRVLELPAGAAAGRCLRAGDKLELRDAEPTRSSA
jgi:uncharacterized membrane protein (UPF0127 family)